MTYAAGHCQGAPSGNLNDDTVAREDQVYGNWMIVKPRNGRSIRIARKEVQDSSHINGKGGNRFNILTSTDNAVEQEEGNHRTKVLEQRGPVNKPEAFSKSKKTDSKPKSTSNNETTSTPFVGPRTTTKVPTSSSSIFVSPTYKESSQPTSLGPDHSAVILSPLPGEENPSTAADFPQASKPSVVARIGSLYVHPPIGLPNLSTSTPEANSKFLS